jgi:hypothetical protein
MLLKVNPIKMGFSKQFLCGKEVGLGPYLENEDEPFQKIGIPEMKSV